MSDIKLLDVIIIGAGWSGLLACKHSRQEGLTVKVLEARDNIGGVWCYSDDKSIPTVMRTTRTSSSAAVTEISDFPMPDEIGDFPHHADILKYLHDYCDKFKLYEYIQLQTKVQEIKKQDRIWEVKTNRNEIFKSRNVIVCCGLIHVPDTSVKDTIFHDFQGDIIHAGELKKFESYWSGKRVLLFGGGETASDILENWYQGTQRIVWSMPRGQHFFRKQGKMLPYTSPQAFDKASSRMTKMVSPFVKGKPGISWACKWTTSGSLLAYQGHGIPEWKNDVVFMHNLVNKQGHVLDFVDHEKVVPKRGIKCVDGSTITFEDGSCEIIDAIILCTGYNTSHKFLPAEYRNSEIAEKFKFVFDVRDTSLAFIGYTRPVIGSIPAIAEFQAIWVARVFSDKIKIPPLSEREAIVSTDIKFWREYFHGTSRRIGSIVEGYTYFDDVAKMAGCCPNYWSLFWRNPRGFFTAYSAPYNGSSMLLNDSKQEEQALQNLERRTRDMLPFYSIFIFLFLRLIWFDWFLDKLCEVKFVIQKSKIWKQIRGFLIVRLLNSIWVLPKRYLFDSTHYHIAAQNNNKR